MLIAENLTKRYVRRGDSVSAIDGVSFTVSPGELVVLQGPSGSGKSTLLLVLGGMLKPTSGSVRHGDLDLFALSRTRRNGFRRKCVGFLFQKFHLMPYLSVYDNIRLPLQLQGVRVGVRERVTEMAGRLGVASRLRHKPSELSVGEQQRVAAARTLVADPQIILADEPTGNLDKANGDIIARCFAEESERGRTVILATHDEALLSLGTRRLQLDAGRLET